MRILHYLDGVGPAGGGPSRSVPNLATALAVSGVEVTLCHSSRSPATDEVRRAEQAGVRVQGRQHSGRRGWESELACTDVVHLHGIWSWSVHQLSSRARQLQKPLVHSPRGMLEPWALRTKRWRKKLAWGAYQRRDLELATRVHATSELEASHLARRGLDGRLVVIQNGTEMPLRPLSPREDRHEIVFLSRLHRKKGLDLLAAAARELREELGRNGWSIIVAGPEEDDSRRRLESYLETHRLEHLFALRGPVYGPAKWELLSRASLFVLPTHSENFGLAIAEALAAGTPVITTTAAPWSELQTHDCGWWVAPEVGELTAALRDAIRSSPERRATMGARGRLLVEAKYSWPAVADRFRLLYEDILRGE